MLSNLLWREFFEKFTDECKTLYSKKGFNYDIPKEEQIRSSLYSFFRNRNVPVEVESNVYRKKKTKYQGTPLYDLRILSEDSDILIEIKRATALSIWTNDFKTFVRYWKDDIDKLEFVDNEEDYDKWNIKEKNTKCFLLVCFKNNDDKTASQQKKLEISIHEFQEYVKNKWTGANFFETEFTNLGEVFTGYYGNEYSDHEISAKLLAWWKEK